MEVKFEYQGEDREIPGAAIYDVEAIHVTTTRNQRRFTQKELEHAAVSLAFRQLNINHDISRGLKWPENTTLGMEYSPEKQAVVGRIRVADEHIKQMIELGKIKKLSIEQIPTKGETCNKILCEQHGVAFIGLALLEFDVTPGDEMAEIKRFVGFEYHAKVEACVTNDKRISDLLVSNAQRECKECTDETACHTCRHQVEAQDDCIQKHIRAMLDNPDDKGKPRDQIVAIAINKCQPEMSIEAGWFWYNRTIEKFSFLFESK